MLNPDGSRILYHARIPMTGSYHYRRMDALSAYSILAVAFRLGLTPSRPTLVVEAIGVWNTARAATVVPLIRQVGAWHALADMVGLRPDGSGGLPLAAGPTPHEWKELHRPAHIGSKAWCAKGAWQRHFLALAQERWPEDCHIFTTKRGKILDGLLAAAYIADWYRVTGGHDHADGEA